jgi:hypothetical protein
MHNAEEIEEAKLSFARLPFNWITLEWPGCVCRIMRMSINSLMHSIRNQYVFFHFESANTQRRKFFDYGGLSTICYYYYINHLGLFFLSLSRVCFINFFHAKEDNHM